MHAYRGRKQRFLVFVCTHAGPPVFFYSKVETGRAV
nr:MAG TPA: hypothetical protein [Bacteriophage sp.]